MTVLRPRQWRKEDLSGLMDAEPKFEEFLSAFNAMNTQLSAIVNGGVGTDNLNAQDATFEVAKSQAYPIKLKSSVKGAPRGVRVLQALKTTNKPGGEPVGAAFHVDWHLEGGIVLVDGLPGLSSSESYRVSVEIVGS